MRREKEVVEEEKAEGVEIRREKEGEIGRRREKGKEKLHDDVTVQCSVGSAQRHQRKEDRAR